MTYSLHKNLWLRIRQLFNYMHCTGLPWYVVFPLVTAYYTGVLNLQLLSHFYRILAEGDALGTVFALTPPLVLFSILTVVFLCFLFRIVFKTVMVFLIVAGAMVGYFAYNYGIIFDYDMMVNLLQTNTAEVATYINFKSAANTLIFGILPAALLVFVKIRWPDTWLHAVLGRLAFFFRSSAVASLHSSCLLPKLCFHLPQSQYLKKRDLSLQFRVVRGKSGQTDLFSCQD